MIRRFAIVVAISVILCSAASAVEAPLPRHPAPSPDGTQIAFSWQGDLWLVPVAGGEARRLTANPATERFPVWSRDGRLIAFASNRYGNDDVFVMPADGSAAPTRLTFASTSDVPDDFTPDLEAVLFTSNRAESVKWGTQLWTVPLAGGTPALAQDAFGEAAGFSPDGESLVFVRGQTKWTRRGYRGPASRDLWLRAGDDYERLTDFDGTDDCPTWLDGGHLAFLSSRDGRKNVYRLDVATKTATQLTFHEGSAVRFPRAAADGSVIAYEFEDGIWTVPPAGGPSTRLSIQVAADQVNNPVDRRTATDDADELAISPNGKLAAFIVHGDVFVTAIVDKDDQEIAKPPTARVTTTPERERDLSWSPDGKTLLFSSAANGNDDLYTAVPTPKDTPWPEAFDFRLTRLTDAPAEEYAATFSPGGDRIAFIRGQGQLVVRPKDGGAETVLLDHWAAPNYAWSPDGAWIAYSTSDEHYNSEVWVVPSTNGERYNVSRHPDDDFAPRWSPDGRRLVWTAKRADNTFDLWGVWLAREDDERTPAQWLKLWADKGGDKKKGKDKDDASDDDDEDEKKPELPTVSIDFERLWERVRRITDLKGDEGPARISPDGKTIIFTAEFEGEEDLYSVRWDGEDLERLTKDGAEPEQFVFDRKGKTIFYLDGKGHIKRVGLDGKAGDPIPFKARYVVDARLERAVVFDEAWRALNENFYDPDFHGVDWPAQQVKYRPWALAASTKQDFADIVNLMLGELNASHMGYYPPGTRGRAIESGDRTGWIGVTYDPAAGGPGILIKEVLPDSPAWRADAAIQPGERLVAVNGIEIEDTTNVFELFVDTEGERTPLTVRGIDGDERTVVVEPVASQRGLRYDEWVRQRRALTDRWSGGRLGYIHIQGMDIPSFEEFERMLFAAADGKEGLLVDVRSNGGGWTTDYLMAVLMVQRHAYTVPRGGDPAIRAYPQSRLPLSAWTRPAAAICNEDSYSNAEIFSHAFKSLGRGPLIGSPTFGAVISTGGMRTLDGSTVRLPGRGWFVAPTGLNMEHNGAVPDVLVWQPPSEDASATEDTQLARAVQVLLANLETDPRAGAW